MEARILNIEGPQSQYWNKWETLVSGNPACGVMQSLHWASFKRLQGLGQLHVGLFDAEELVGGAIFYCSSKTNGAGILVAPEGPVLSWDDANYAAVALRAIIQCCEEYARANGVMAMRIEPRIPRPVSRILREFGRAPVDLIPVETLQLNLTQSETEILASMKPKGRYNIGLSQRNGVRVYESFGTDAIDLFYDVIVAASQRDGFALESKGFFTHLAQSLCSPGIAKFLFAEHEGQILGTMILLNYGDRATYLYGGITNEKRNLMGGYALQWEAMKISKRAGCAIYDFYGFDQFGSPLHAYSRFSQFKRQFGGGVVRLIGAHDHFFLDNLADAFIKVVNQSPALSRLHPAHILV